MIVSSTKGRVRLRDKSFINSSLPLDKLRSLTGVSLVDHNPKTGSILIKYTPEELDFEKCAQVLEELDPDAFKSLMDQAQYEAQLDTQIASMPLENQDSAKDPNKTLNETVGLIIAIVSVLASGFLKQKKFHVMAGMFLVEMLFEHLWRFRHRLKGKFNIFSLFGLKRNPFSRPKVETQQNFSTITVLDDAEKTDQHPQNKTDD